MPLQLVTPPAEEPVSLIDAKLHLRVDFDEDDTLIASLISAARQAAETLTGRQFTTARWKMVLDCFPGPSLMGVPAGQPFTLPGHAILLPKCPVQTVVSINYLDMGSALQTMSFEPAPGQHPPGPPVHRCWPPGPSPAIAASRTLGPKHSANSHQAHAGRQEADCQH